MSSAISVRCRCGAFSGQATLRNSDPNTRIVCYCADCQTYARHLGQANRVLGAQGGTDIVQISPACFHIKRGKQHLAMLRLSPEGIYRWYTSCCRTPICNTPPSIAMPYLALLTINIQPGDSGKVKRSAGKNYRANDENLDALLGPVSFGVGAGSQHPISAAWPVYKGFGLRGIIGTLKNIGRWRIRGDQKRSELIDADTAIPVVEPYILTPEERDAAS